MKRLISLLLCLVLIVPCAFAEELPRRLEAEDADYPWLYEKTLAIAERFQKGLDSTWHSFLLSAANVPENEMLEALSPLRLQDYAQPWSVTIVRADQTLPNELLAEWSSAMAAIKAEKEAKAAAAEEARRAAIEEEKAARAEAARIAAEEEAARLAAEAEAPAAENGELPPAEGEAPAAPEAEPPEQPQEGKDAAEFDDTEAVEHQDEAAQPDGQDASEDAGEAAQPEEAEEFEDLEETAQEDEFFGFDELNADLEDPFAQPDGAAETASIDDFTWDEDWDLEEWDVDWEIDWEAELGWDVDFSALEELKDRAPSPYDITDDPARDLYHASPSVLNYQGDPMFDAISNAIRVTGIYECAKEMEAPCYAVIQYGGLYALLVTYYPVMEGWVSVNAQVILSRDADSLLTPAE